MVKGYLMGGLCRPLFLFVVFFRSEVKTPVAKHPGLPELIFGRAGISRNRGFLFP